MSAGYPVDEWNPLTTTGASRYSHLFLAVLWMLALVRT